MLNSPRKKERTSSATWKVREGGKRVKAERSRKSRSRVVMRAKHVTDRVPLAEPG